MSWQFDLCGDHLALDFANTVSDRDTDAAVERIGSYGDLLSFARQTGIVSASRCNALSRRARRDPAAAEATLGGALRLREALYGLFAAVAREVPPAIEDLAVLNGELPRLRLGADLALGWDDSPERLDAFLGAIVQAAVELASRAEQRSRVRLCEAPDCVWLFYDTSRNRSRRWCDMRQCGNRMKARRHYARERGGGRGGPWRPRSQKR